MYLTRVRLDSLAGLPGWLTTLPMVRALAHRPLELTAKVTIITGDNGAGKSTLVEAIAVAMGANPEGGSRHAHFATAAEASRSRLAQAITCTRQTNPRDVYFVRGESFFNLAEYYETLGGETTYDDLPRLSHGQSLMKLFRNRIGSGTLLLLDEPEDGLSIFRQLELLGLLVHATDAGAQVILSTHSPVLLAIPQAQILDVANGLAPIAFEDAEAVTAYQEFVRDPHGTVSYLVGDADE